MSTGKKVWAYRRENGRVGIRNYVVIVQRKPLENGAIEKQQHARRH